MNNYAMICKNRVIEILIDQEVSPVWPPTPEGFQITVVECDDTVERGMIYDPETNTFSEYIPPEPTPEPLTESEEHEIDHLLTTEYIACLLENQLI